MQAVVLALLPAGLLVAHFLGEWGLETFVGSGMGAYQYLLAPMVVSAVLTALVLFYSMVLTVMRCMKALIAANVINHIPIRTAAEAVVTPIQLHAWGFIIMERAASHPVPTYMDSIMLRSLSCCDGLLHSFKYIQIYPSLKIRKAPDIL